MQDYSQLERFGVHYCHPTPGKALRVAYEVLMNVEVKEVANIVHELEAGYDLVVVCTETVNALKGSGVGMRRL